MLFSIFWGTPSLIGSLCNLREIVRRTQVDKTVKVFNVGDEFLMHAFKAHLSARICHLFKVKSRADKIDHPSSLQWLRGKAESLVGETVYPESSKDPVYGLHRTFLHTAFLYVDLRTQSDGRMARRLSVTGSYGCLGL